MNLAAYVQGSIKALRGQEDWPGFFDLSRQGFFRSFLALFLTLPCYYVCAIAVSTQRSRITGEGVDGVPLAPFALIFTLFSLTFVCSVYILTMVFDKQDRFKPWVIVRHWAIFFAVLLAAALLGLTIIGVLPFTIASYAALIIYLGTLAIDIRLAQKVAGFEWGAAILTGCIITGMGFAILLTGVVQFSQ